MDDETKRQLSDLGSDINTLWRYLDAKDRADAYSRQASEIEQSVNVMRKELATHYDRLTSANERYTNVIVLVGFASYFATWTYTKELLIQSEMALVGLLGLISVGAFVIAELIGMILRAHFARRVQTLIGHEYLPEEFNTKIHELKTEERRIMSGYYLAWLLLFLTSVVAAFVGGFRLIWALGRVYYPLLPPWY